MSPVEVWVWYRLVPASEWAESCGALREPARVLRCSSVQPPVGQRPVVA